MSFSRGQQPELRQYLTWAWADHCRTEGLDPLARCHGSSRCGACAYCALYEEILIGATGKRSSSQCNAGRHYDLLMRDLEIIHGRSIKWQMKAHTGDANRILHELREAVGDHNIDEDYLRAVAKRMLKLDHAPQLLDLTREDLITILGEVKRYIRRRLRHDAAPIEQADASGDPVWAI